jgi:hypothetical protein
MNGAADHAQLPSAGLGPEGTDNVPIRLPPVKVRIEPQDVAAFLRETASPQRHVQVPLTFPVRWLALPAVHDLIMRSIGSGFIPIHEAQNFAYERALQIEADYILGVEACRTPAPPCLTLRMSIATAEGDICARLETVMRIVPALKPA